MPSASVSSGAINGISWMRKNDVSGVGMRRAWRNIGSATPQLNIDRGVDRIDLFAEAENVISVRALRSPTPEVADGAGCRRRWHGGARSTCWVCSAPPAFEAKAYSYEDTAVPNDVGSGMGAMDSMMFRAKV